MPDLRLVPPGIDDAVSRAIDRLLDRYDALDVAAVLVTLVDRQSDMVLEYLAWEHHIDFWERATTREAKIAMIQACYDAHRYKGTRYGLEQIYVLLDAPGAVAEWFEYGGDPYYFRVDLIWQGRPWPESQYDYVLGMIEQLKNVRSWLDRLRIIPQVSGTTYTAAVAWSGAVVAVRPPIVTEITTQGGPRAGAGYWSVAVCSVYPPPRLGPAAWCGMDSAWSDMDTAWSDQA